MQTLPLRLVAVVILSLVAVACSTSPGASGPAPSSPVAAPTLAGTEWQLVAIDGRQPPAGSRLTLELAADRVTGNGGCNEFGGAYTFDPATGTLAIGDLVSTKRACVEPALNDLEQAYLTALDGATSVALDSTGRLVLAGGGGQLIFGRVR